MRAVVLCLVGVLFAGMGLYVLAARAAPARPFGLSVPTAVSRAEIRAVYGGFGVAVAGVLFWSAFGAGEPRAGAAGAKSRKPTGRPSQKATGLGCFASVCREQLRYK